MTDREKVIKGLEEAEIMLIQAVDRGGEMAVMGAFKCLNRVTEALELLKEQEAKPVLSERECETLPNHYERKGFLPEVPSSCRVVSKPIILWILRTGGAMEMTKSEVKKALDEIRDMSDEEIADNGQFIRKADEVETSGKSNKFTREYIFNAPFLRFSIMCRPNSCLFCRECTDIYYDSHGPYGIVCLKGGNFEDGMLGKCPYQKEKEGESK